MAVDPQASSSQWEGSSVEAPTLRTGHLVLSGGAYMVDDSGPATASLVYSAGTLTVDSDPNAAGRVSILYSEGGGPLTLTTT